MFCTLFTTFDTISIGRRVRPLRTPLPSVPLRVDPLHRSGPDNVGRHPIRAEGDAPVNNSTSFAVTIFAECNMTRADEKAIKLLEEARQGDRKAIGELLDHYRARLRRMVALRIDRRMQGRIDPSDVIQETYLEASNRLADYLRDPTMPFFIWLRFLTGQRLAMLHRHHLGIQARDAGREVSIYYGALPEATSAALAARLVGRLTSPSVAAARAEMKIRLQEALNSMDPLDREVLALRHFEQLSNAETAEVLGIKATAACNRYVRALERLKAILTSIPGGVEEHWK
jgi:RNA polymerase sigma-70 factor (ECF subfamily)